MADPYYDNPTYSVIDSTTLEQSPSLTLTILLEAWPINSYPYATQLPSGSVLIIAGQNTASGNPPSPVPPPPPIPVCIALSIACSPSFIYAPMLPHLVSAPMSALPWADSCSLQLCLMSVIEPHSLFGTL